MTQFWVKIFVTISIWQIGVSIGDDSANENAIKSWCDLSVRNYKLLTPLEEGDVDENDDNVESDNDNENTAESYCDCDMTRSAPFILPQIAIDCSVMGLTNDKLLAKQLPYGTELLDLSWNNLTSIPSFKGTSNQMTTLKLDNNEIGIIKADDLLGLSSLRVLNLAFNLIGTIESGAFDNLTMLTHLNLAYNNISMMPDRIFWKLTNILQLDMSGNDLNKMLIDKNLYYDLKLDHSIMEVLILESCNLTWLNVHAGSSLTEVRLRGNKFTSNLPSLPKSIKILDLSMNPIRKLNKDFYAGELKMLKVLLLEDMPFMNFIDVSSLSTFTKLQRLSLQGSRNFSAFHKHAFDPVESDYEPEEHIFENLTEILFTGTKLRKLHEDVLIYAPNLAKIDLRGCPMVCDCDLKWIIESDTIETNGVCDKPLSFNNKTIDDLTFDMITNCSTFSRGLFRAMNAVLIILLLVLCGVAMYFLVLGCRPSKKFYVQQRFGANSPYSRITVEPNRATLF